MTKKRPKTLKRLTGGSPAEAMVPAISARGLRRAVARTVLDKAPVLGTLTKWHDNIEEVHREERLSLWLEFVRGDQPGEDFKAKIASGLEGPHAEYVRDAVLESTRAATEALDDAAVPAIARLTSRYLHSKKPDLWTYRDVLSLLRSLDTEMITALRTAIKKLREIAPGQPVATEFDIEDPANVETLIWRAAHDLIDRPHLLERTNTELGRGPHVYRLVTALNGSSTGLFSGSSRVNPPHFTPEVIETLDAVL